MRFSILAIVSAAFMMQATEAAWSFRIYENAGYGGKTLRYSGKSPVQSCHEVDSRLDNKASSFRYSTSCCHLKMYAGHGCSGKMLGSTTDNWNVRQISNENNDKLSSFHIDCRRELSACI
ncbi:hypothetical protein G6F46_011932 [Rhizopus delemar]|uniref:Beta/gamma crystallin 'Greek key' domain-containing protein n=3 Tax=Rhizopus TaxID=4842 RepID=I1C9B1_RHIO9|nr:hypothetical protein RO3G_09751 [Rhizopus delemar RA 99-880]KAG1048174.1 hypothetical protein G6F43_009416 [Rhizopus delemar]KAG1534589.1 hypothetical protein G6F51_012013 [Rhizopus arrhizus]KAG1446271.1 hypothetical protein G6F55_011617 [Rhizopus delemar]KAG1489003.1 hypothetical protein G6F54_011752 [Rhizopus delemar]|eukprot:EIE85041.1 hypothetical protein RO3G_09751 [Rhizopus delemar RA 99-880]